MIPRLLIRHLARHLKLDREGQDREWLSCELHWEPCVWADSTAEICHLSSVCERLMGLLYLSWSWIPSVTFLFHYVLPFSRIISVSWAWILLDTRSVRLGHKNEWFPNSAFRCLKMLLVNSSYFVIFVKSLLLWGFWLVGGFRGFVCFVGFGLFLTWKLQRYTWLSSWVLGLKVRATMPNYFAISCL